MHHLGNHLIRVTDPGSIEEILFIKIDIILESDQSHLHSTIPRRCLYYWICQSHSRALAQQTRNVYQRFR